jgi:hypothetical protein
MAGHAAACYAPNEGAGILYNGLNFATGGSTEVDLWLAAGPASGRAIIHPFQLLSNVAGSDDFVGWGTARGVGTSGGITDCPDDYSSGWHVYADGIQDGSYWCRQGGYGTLPNIAANQQFKFRYTTCPSTGLTRWVMYLNGTQKTCAWVDSGSGVLAAGGESIGTTATQDIDVDFEALHYHMGGVWYLWGPSTDTTCGPSFNDPPYFVTEVSDINFEIRSGI